MREIIDRTLDRAIYYEEQAELLAKSGNYIGASEARANAKVLFNLAEKKEAQLNCLSNPKG